MQLLNLDKSETIHQRCLLVKGRCEKESATYVTIETQDPFGYKVFPEQTWPVALTEFRALVFLVAGENVLRITSDTQETIEVSVNYLPLTSLPPVHLVLFASSESGMTMDCSPARSAGISSAHSSSDAAIAKLRMMAYMWMAVLAEDMRLKGLGRRSFRLEEEWTADTVSRSHVNSKIENTLHSIMQTTAKVHVVGTSKTVEELRSDDVNMPTVIDEALSAWGSPFTSTAHPAIALLVLDAHYSMEKGKALASWEHANHQPDGVSLAYWGSRFTHASPSYIEEVTSCFLDKRIPGKIVGCDDPEDAMWKICAQAQLSFRHLFSALGADDKMQPDRNFLPLSKSQWASFFLPRALVLPEQSGEELANKELLGEEVLNLRQALRLQVQPQFRLPHEKAMAPQALEIKPTIRIDMDPKSDDPRIFIESSEGICRIIFRDNIIEPTPTLREPINNVSFSLEELTDRFTRKTPLKIEAISINGQHDVVENAWRLIDLVDYIKIPGVPVKLMRRSVATGHYIASKKNYTSVHGPQDQTTPNRRRNRHGYEGDFSEYYRWNVLLSKRLANGTIIRATAIEVHVGACFDGAVVKYANNEEINCAPRYERGGEPFRLGGNTNTCRLEAGDELSRVEVLHDGNELGGVRFVTARGHRGGRANGGNPERLEAPEGHKIIGLYGAWSSPYHTHEFGIITAPRDFELPSEAYDMDELNNRDPNDPNRPGARNEQNGNRGVQPHEQEENNEDDSDAQSMDDGLEEDEDEDEDDDDGDDDDEDEDHYEDAEDDDQVLDEPVGPLM